MQHTRRQGGIGSGRQTRLTLRWRSGMDEIFLRDRTLQNTNQSIFDTRKSKVLDDFIIYFSLAQQPRGFMAVNCRSGDELEWGAKAGRDRDGEFPYQSVAQVAISGGMAVACTNT